MLYRRGFTLIELLVVVGIIGLLMAILIPALAGARQAAMTTKCLANMRSLEQAHIGYMTENNGAFINIGLGHSGGATYDEDLSWINALSRFYGSELLRRSPLDDSPHWEEDGGVPAPSGAYRQTSYGVNNYLTADGSSESVTRLHRVAQPARTVHFLLMAFEGDFATADHPHVEEWYNAARPERSPLRAAQQVAIGAHSETSADLWNATSVYGFLDGSARVMSFNEVYTDFDHNLFDPESPLH
ncbi:MAG: prepilin-type N-terminal cleavage/methylation domain-containing protein [Phycisphaeraceae bacterium]